MCAVAVWPRRGLLCVWALVLVAGWAASSEARRGGGGAAVVAQTRLRYLTPHARDAGAHAGVERPKMPPLIPVPPVRQHSAAACGIACLESLFAYYGKGSLRAGQLVRRAHESYAYGTDTPDMKRVAREQGLDMRARHGWTLAELFAKVQQGTPVTVGYQAWVTNPENVDWRSRDDDGHYSIVLGFGDRAGRPYPSLAAMRRDLDHAVLWMMDPSADLGARGWMPVKEFMERWHWGTQSHFGMALVTESPPVYRAFVSGRERIR
jgi:hypothetical protein